MQWKAHSVPNASLGLGHPSHRDSSLALRSETTVEFITRRVVSEVSFGSSCPSEKWSSRRLIGNAKGIMALQRFFLAVQQSASKTCAPARISEHCRISEASGDIVSKG